MTACISGVWCVECGLHLDLTDGPSDVSPVTCRDCAGTLRPGRYGTCETCRRILCQEDFVFESGWSGSPLCAKCADGDLESDIFAAHRRPTPQRRVWAAKAQLVRAFLQANDISEAQELAATLGSLPFTP